RLATARGSEQGIGAAIAPLEVDLPQGVVGLVHRTVPVAVAQALEADAGHRRQPSPGGALAAPASTSRPSASKYSACSTSRSKRAGSPTASWCTPCAIDTQGRPS